MFENMIPKDNLVVQKNKLQILREKKMIHNDNLQKVVWNGILQKKKLAGKRNCQGQKFAKFAKKIHNYNFSKDLSNT